MQATKINLKQALRIDFTGKLGGFKQFRSFGPDIVSLIRTPSEAQTLIVIDYGYGIKAPHLVRDHLNLTGTNPLIGPNDPCGERFPSVNDIYVVDDSVACGIAAGLKPGIKPSGDDVALMESLGADFYCFNLVPTMIVAAHSRYRVLAILVPEGFDADQVSALIKKLEDKI